MLENYLLLPKSCNNRPKKNAPSGLNSLRWSKPFLNKFPLSIKPELFSEGPI